MIITVFHSLLLLGLITAGYLNAKHQPLSNWYLPALTFKIFCGWLIGGMYLHYYEGGDTWNYFQDGVVLADLLHTDWKQYVVSWFDSSELPDDLIYHTPPRAVLMGRLVSIGCIFTQNNYWIISSYFSLISFSAIWYLVQTLSRLNSKSSIAAGIAWLVYPSFVFWSSGILKECLAIALISGMVALCLRWYIEKKHSAGSTISYILVWAGGSMGLWALKYYYAAALIPITLAILVSIQYHRKKYWSLGVMVATLSLSIGLVSLLRPNLALTRFLEVAVSNYESFRRISDPDNLIYYYELAPSIGSILINMPIAWFSAWYRPLWGETHGWIQHLAGIENWMLFGMSIMAFLKLKNLRKVRSDLLLWITGGLLYAVILGSMLAISAPNFGTLLRYKVAYSPFVAYFILLLLLSSSGPRSYIDRHIG